MMVYVLLIYVIGAGWWLIHWLIVFESYYTKESGKRRSARYILATPIWPILTIIFIIRGFIELVKMAL